MRKLIFMHLKNARTVGTASQAYIYAQVQKASKHASLPVFKHKVVGHSVFILTPLWKAPAPPACEGFPPSAQRINPQKPCDRAPHPLTPGQPLAPTRVCQGLPAHALRISQQILSQGFPHPWPSTPVHRNRRDGPSLCHGLAAPGSAGRGCCARSAMADTIASTPAAILPAQSLACWQHQKLLDNRHHSGRTALPVFPQVTAIIP